jgi:hypothetical protein
MAVTKPKTYHDHVVKAMREAADQVEKSTKRKKAKQSSIAHTKGVKKRG